VGLLIVSAVTFHPNKARRQIQGGFSYSLGSTLTNRGSSTELSGPPFGSETVVFVRCNLDGVVYRIKGSAAMNDPFTVHRVVSDALAAAYGLLSSERDDDGVLPTMTFGDSHRQAVLKVSDHLISLEFVDRDLEDADFKRKQKADEVKARKDPSHL
jgi:hypothetical protein